MKVKMPKVALPKIFKVAQIEATKHMPGMLTALGIGGMAATVFLTGDATIKAVELVKKDKEEKKEKEPDKEYTKTDAVKAGWKPYIWPVVTFGLSTACLIGASSVNAKRNAALATALTLSETARTEYQDKVKELFGEKKEQKVQDEVIKDKVENAPMSTSTIIVANGGKSRFYDTVLGREFYSDIDSVRKAVNSLNYRLRSEMYISLNEFLYELDQEPSRLGDELGWNIDDGEIDIQITPVLRHDEPVIALSYNLSPRFKYGDF